MTRSIAKRETTRGNRLRQTRVNLSLSGEYCRCTMNFKYKMLIWLGWGMGKGVRVKLMYGYISWIEWTLRKNNSVLGVNCYLTFQLYSTLSFSYFEYAVPLFLVLLEILHSLFTFSSSCFEYAVPLFLLFL